MILEAAEMTLRARLNARGLEIPHANVCIKHVLDGLSELHKNHVVHLDVKPENMFMVLDQRTRDQAR